MSFVKTYSENLDIQNHFPVVFSNSSRPTLENIEGYRDEVYGMINERLGGTTADLGGLKRLEIRKVIQMVENYYARGRGERSYFISITDEDMFSLRINQATSGSGFGGGHYSVDIP